MRRIISNLRGFAAVELVVIVVVIVIPVVLSYSLLPPVKNAHHDTRCENNLKNIYSALILYRNRYMKYPDEAGDLFLATLYYTKILTDYDVFICPADALNDGAEFTDETARRIGTRPAGWEEGNPLPKDEWNDNTVGPTEISYAARWNVRKPRNHPGERWYHLNDDTKEITPLVCDDFEDEHGELRKIRLTHDDDHINVLWTGGKVEALKERIRVGQKDTILEALKN